MVWLYLRPAESAEVPREMSVVGAFKNRSLGIKYYIFKICSNRTYEINVLSFQ